MAENTFKSPGFFEREIELTAEKEQPTGVPAGIIGAAKMGPAFVPLTLGTFNDFENRFGSLTPEKFAPYAVNEWLKNRQAVTFMRVLGAGANSSSSDFTRTRQFGVAKNAGFKCVSSANPGADENNSTANLPGATQFLSAVHVISANSDIGFPMFTDSTTLKGIGSINPVSTMTVNANADSDGLTGADASLRETSAAADDMLHITRAMILNTSGSYFQLKNTDGEWNPYNGEVVEKDGSNTLQMKLVLSDGATNDTNGWGNDDSATEVGSGVNKPNRVYTVSFDPDNTAYIGKVLNTDPKKFQEEGHLLYLDFAIEHELAPVVSSKTDAPTRDDDKNYAFLSTGATGSGPTDSTYVSTYSSERWKETFGRFDARYQAPKTSAFISQPYGGIEYDLFHFECLSDGHVANNEFKVSISNIKKSTDPNYEYGSFNVEIRKYSDSDFAPQIIEQFVEVNLDPSSDQFVGRKIGDKKVAFDFDADLEEERRLVISGRYPNKSLNVRIVINDAVYKGQVPKTALPFGFHGIPVLDTANSKLGGSFGSTPEPHLPPMPYTFKATKGQIKATGYSYQGHAGDNERADSRIYWGVKTTRIEDDKVQSNAILQSNISSKPSKLVEAYTKFMGIPGGSITIGNKVSDPDAFNDNKFTLAKVALSYQLGTDLGGATTDYSNVGSPITEMKSAAYIRNGVNDPANYSVSDNYDSTGYSKRPTFASLVHDKTANHFNKFSKFMKFTNVFYGGWDGLNFLDGDIEDLNDKASSTDQGGKAANTVTGGLGLTGTNNGAMMGTGKDNNVIASYRQAIKIMTEPMTVRHNLLSIPGIRDPYITDFAANSVRDYSMAMYIMDIPNYGVVSGVNNTRLYDTGPRPDVEFTANNFESRAIDNNYAAAYFPDIYLTDQVNNRRVLAPASIAAMGALSYNDNVSYPWFAPAGFNRGALDFVENVRTRLAVSDRDDLYERRINPIANFPNGGFVIFGQKTLQITQSSLDRVNVRRLLLEVKRQVKEVASVVLFEQNTPETRARFVNLVQPRLALIQAQAGIEKFKVICDDSNNTEQDREENKLNGKIVLIPTRTIEFIAIDFIVTNAGVSFE